MFPRSRLAGLAVAAAAAFLVGGPAAAQGSAAKQDLIAKILQAQTPGIEQLARTLVEQPAGQLLQRAGVVVQNRIPEDQRQKVAQELQADVREYVSGTLPGVAQRAKALAPLTIGPLLEKEMTEQELREVLAVFESTAWRKFQGLAPEMQKALGSQLVESVKPQVETSLRALDASMAKRLGINPSPPPAAGGTGN